MTTASPLPVDALEATLVGRMWRPDVAGPAVVALRGDELVDITASSPTVRDLCERPDPVAAAAAAGEAVATLDAVLANTPRASRDPARPWLLSPIDLQAIKAAGVTFPVSLLERVIEERAAGSPERADAIRAEVQGLLGGDLARLRPGSPEAMALKATLVREGIWSQYLEVGIGPDAELFTKAQPMSSVGHLAEVGIGAGSTWNNPEPEVALVVSSAGSIVGATLGNDVNLRDVEGRSALLLGRAKDNNASASLGPFVRLFDGRFGLDDIRRAEVRLVIEGADGYRLEGTSDMSRISRDPADLVASTIGRDHGYPDGMVLYLGTMFAPVADRDAPGMGFTHHEGDVVTISSPRLGALVNTVVPASRAEPWAFGTGALMRNLAARGLL
ncbi:MAG: fumarylacetoacetate hydrolase family protein [Candidatus Limnocylindrales bacterium]